MDRKTSPGLIKRGDTWYIQKRIGNGRRIRESCGTDNVEEAERYLARRNEEIRNAQLYGIRPKRTFAEAALKYLAEEEKTSLEKDHWALKRIEPFIGQLPLENVHAGTLRPYIEHGKSKGWKHRTINMPLEIVRHILNLAAGEWIDEHGLTWLQSAPKIRLLSRSDARDPYPMSWDEQETLFSALPEHLRQMALFAVNTGCREQEVCTLMWDYEVEIPELETSVFIIPKEKVKNRHDRVVVLNTTGKEVIDAARGQHSLWVFVYRGEPVKHMNDTAWRRARRSVNMDQVRVHDLKHTFGRRLRSAGVSFEDRQDLLGHKSGRITTHYSAPELVNLIQAAERVCRRGGHKVDPIITLKKNNRLRVVA